MLHSKRFFGFLLLATSCGFAIQTAGCGDDDATTPTEDSGLPDTNTAADTGAPDTSPADAADAAKPSPVFLDPSDYTDDFAIDPSFPYGVTQKHAADGTIGSGGVKWGTSSPIVTAMPSVTTWTIPSDPKGAATSAVTTAATPTGLPAPTMNGPFFESDAFVELPFGFALQSYTTSPAPFAGEALLYAPAFGSVASRAFTNGLYSGVGVTDGTTNAIVYSGLSPLAAAASATDDNGLYAAALCAGQLLPTGTCAASHKLFGWAGASGPVVADTLGDVFVAASLGASGAVYGLTKTQALGTGAATQATLASDATLSGIGSAAALAGTGAFGGWVTTIGFNDFTTNAVQDVYAVDYTTSASGVAKGAHDYASVITPTATVTGIALFSDNDGNLWMAVTTATAGNFYELELKP